MHTNRPEGEEKVKIHDVHLHTDPPVDADSPGYETKDINVGGVATFVAGLSFFVLIFFVFCFFMGKAINYAIVKQDGPRDKWHQLKGDMGQTPRGQKLEQLESNAAMEQQQLAEVANKFPHPRLEIDDGNQDIADLHAREDLLLDYYSTASDLPAGTIRIPVARAMELIVQRGLPKAAEPAQTGPLMYGETPITIQAPLTDGFARTGYELDQIEARQQRMDMPQADK